MAKLSNFAHSEDHNVELEDYIRYCIENPQYMRLHIPDIKAKILMMCSRESMHQMDNNNDTTGGIGHT